MNGKSQRRKDDFDITRTFQIIMNNMCKVLSLGTKWMFIGNNNNNHYNIIVELQEVRWVGKTEINLAQDRDR